MAGDRSVDLVCGHPVDGRRACFYLSTTRYDEECPNRPQRAVFLCM